MVGLSAVRLHLLLNISLTPRSVAKGAVVCLIFCCVYCCGHSRFLLEIADVAADQSEHDTVLCIVSLGRSLQDFLTFVCTLCPNSLDAIDRCAIVHYKFDVMLASLDLLSSSATCGWCCGAPLPPPPQDPFLSGTCMLLHSHI